MKFYHVTTKPAAALIQKGGFRDFEHAVGHIILTGVWFSDSPWYDGANVDLDGLPPSRACLVIDLPEERLAAFELVPDDDEPMYREWCISAALANSVTRAYASA